LFKPYLCHSLWCEGRIFDFISIELEITWLEIRFPLGVVFHDFELFAGNEPSDKRLNLDNQVNFAELLLPLRVQRPVLIVMVSYNKLIVVDLGRTTTCVTHINYI